MHPALWTLLAVVAIGFVYVALPVMGSVYARFRKPRVVRCPETGTTEEVRIDALHAARTGFPGPPDVRVSECTRWPDGKGCDESCVHT